MISKFELRLRVLLGLICALVLGIGIHFLYEMYQRVEEKERIQRIQIRPYEGKGFTLETEDPEMQRAHEIYLLMKKTDPKSPEAEQIKTDLTAEFETKPNLREKVYSLFLLEQAAKEFSKP